MVTINTTSGAPLNVDSSAAALLVPIGAAAQTSYTDVQWITNGGNGEIFKGGASFTGWGGTRAFNIYNSDGVIAFHPSGTANVLQITSTVINATKPIQISGTTVIDASRNVTPAFLANTAGSKLEVMNANETSGHGIYMWDSSDTNWGIYMATAGAGKSLAGGTACNSLDARTAHHVRFRTYGTLATYGWIFENHLEAAKVSITSDSGNIFAVGNVTAYASDARLKTNIKPIKNALKKLSKIRGVEYDWVDNITSEYDFHPSVMHETGVIAQEIQAVIPDAVTTAPMNANYTTKCGTDHKFLTVQKDKIVPLLIEAVKEQQKEIDELKSLVKQLLEK